MHSISYACAVELLAKEKGLRDTHPTEALRLRERSHKNTHVMSIPIFPEKSMVILTNSLSIVRIEI